MGGAGFDFVDGLPRPEPPRIVERLGRMPCELPPILHEKRIEIRVWNETRSHRERVLEQRTDDTRNVCDGSRWPDHPIGPRR